MERAPDTRSLLAVAEDSWKAFDEGGMEAWSLTWDPNIVVDMTTSGIPWFGIYEGREAALQLLNDWVASFAEWRLELEEILVADEGTSLIVVVQYGRGELSGAEVALRYAQVAKWRDGLATRISMYLDVDEARRAAGIAPAG